ncbi:hypothetical protein DS2_13869 [Catenovulum agarivorans DS-2]|uniref:Uncharacterized protein n=1 Tax=Catenovulum agarivorans DS-2 TaxID=1328313 RepID=W7QV40_9ALTE|nr:BNR-4 repeat-containing protein [Catenovulum agarivorans]EWH09165.1 hypothetical protein DS2_13869 [Catenovulum agarivorans DS-2]
MAHYTKYKNFGCKCLITLASIAGLALNPASAAVTLVDQAKITDSGLHFDGKKLTYGTLGSADTGSKFDYFFGRNISAHGDAVKVYKHYVFMTWYRGGKDDRHVMLSRYNTQTGQVATIEFPHRHTGFRGDPNIGESHNTIGLAISPVNGTIHMVYDMHAYDNNNHGGKFKDDYFRYSYSVAGAAEVADSDFTLDQFVKDTSAVSQGPDDYKHLTMTGNLADKANFARLTYPKFFTTTDGTLLLYMRLGGNNNGGYVFNRYDAATQKWSKFTAFNVVSAKNHGNAYNWGLYGNMKYVNGKLRVAFQQRSSNNNDRYKYQNGVYYAYSDHPEGFGAWKNHRGEDMTWPLVNSDEIKVFEPGDYITGHQDANSVYIVGGFDWTVTAKGDIHIISQVRSTDRNRADYQNVKLHSYKPAGADDFIISTEFSGASEIYTAGDNVYIIGLNNGRPFVERAKGGTNDFVRIYEDTDGMQFDHGVLEVHDGKVYYYLMEKGTGTAMPLHLQIIDLDLASEANAPQVSFPSSYMTVEQGYEKLSLTVSATSPVEDRTIESVTLYINDELVRTDDSVPYLFGHGSKPHETGAMGWLDTHSPNPNPLPAGQHVFKAVAVDSEGDTSTATILLTVTSTAPEVSFPNTELTVDEGYEQLGFTISASSPVADRTIDSVTLYLNGELVRQDTSVPFNFGHKFKAHETGAMGWISCEQDPVPSPCHQPNLNPLTEGVHTFTAVAVDSEGEMSEATMTLTVKGPPKPPVVTWPNEVVTVYEGYEKLAITVQAESPVEGRTIESVTLYRNGELVRVDTRPIWNFGHSYAPYEFGAMGWLDRHEPNPNPLGAGEHTFTVVARDNEGLESSADMTLVVLELPAPTVNFVESDIELLTSYSELSVSAQVETASNDISVVSVILYINDELVREVFEAPFVWGGQGYESELLDLPAGTHEFKAVATDSNNKMSEATVVVDIALFGDLDQDGDVDRLDMRQFNAALRAGEITDLRYDFNNDGQLNMRDMNGMARLCSRARCSAQ